MPGILDLLRKAASTGSPSAPAPKSSAGDAGIDIGKMAQDQADKSKPVVGAPYPQAPPKPAYPSSLSSTMTPQTNNGKNK